MPDEPDTPTLGYTALPFEFLFAPAFAGSGKNAPRELEAVVPPGPSVAVTVHCPAALSRVRRDCLVLHPPLHAGIGCRKGAAAGDIRSALSHVLALHALAPAALAVLASVEAKKEESGLIECARSLGLPLLFFSPARLARFPVSFPSPKAREIFGIEGVCEPAALAAARDREGRGHLLVRKTVFQGVTVALALSLRETLTYSLEGHSPGSFRS